MHATSAAMNLHLAAVALEDLLQPRRNEAELAGHRSDAVRRRVRDSMLRHTAADRTAVSEAVDPDRDLVISRQVAQEERQHRVQYEGQMRGMRRDDDRLG